jgi:hypothetical protein
MKRPPEYPSGLLLPTLAYPARVRAEVGILAR